MQIPEHVLVILSELDIINHGARSIATINKQLDRKIYLDVNKTLEAIGGKWDRKAKGHVFDGDAQPRIDYAIAVGEIETNQNLGHFPTPEAIAKQLVLLADVRDGMSALEPSAGTGRIVDVLLDVGAVVTAVEYDADRAAELTSRYSAGAQIEQADFMVWAKANEQGFDRVVMNPPFCKVGEGDAIDHVWRAYDCLVAGGVLVAVLPAGIRFRQDRRHVKLRNLIADAAGEIVDLPDDSFRESGTGVRTVVVRLVRR